MNLDLKLFNILYRFGTKHKKFGNSMLTIAKLSSKFFFILYLTFNIYLLKTKNPLLLPFLIGPAAALFTVQVIRRLITRTRPFICLNIENPLKHSKDSSFPSQHAVSAFAIGTAVLNCFYPLGVLLLIIATLTALSRVFVGVHYPTDIIVGTLLGITIVQFFFLILT